MDETVKEIILKKPSLDEAKAMINEAHGFKNKDGTFRFTLWYGDYRDRLDDIEEIDNIVKTGYPSEDWLEPWYSDHQYESWDYMKKETFPKDEFDIEDIEEDLRHHVFDNDDSNPIKWYVDHSDRVAAYYPLGVEIDDMYGDKKEKMKALRKALKLKKGQYEKELVTLYENATYGGSLVILFGLDAGDFYGDPSEDCKKMTFTDPRICIMDRWNGSGHDVELVGHKITVPFDREKIQVDEVAGGYSYCHDVCGMDVPDGDWN